MTILSASISCIMLSFFQLSGRIPSVYRYILTLDIAGTGKFTWQLPRLRESYGETCVMDVAH